MRRLSVCVPNAAFGNGGTYFTAVGKFGHMLLDIRGKLGHLDQSVVISVAVVQGVDERRREDAMTEFVNF
jgi:hypothetical protein